MVDRGKRTMKVRRRGRERAGCDTLSELWAERGCIGMPGAPRAPPATRVPARKP